MDRSKLRRRRRLGKVGRFLLPLLLGTTVLLLAVTFFLSLRVIYPQAPPDPGTPGTFLIPYEEIRLEGGGAPVTAWFMPGLQEGPSVFLCHDYGSNRGSLLRLAVQLRTAGYNVFLPTMRGHAGSPAGRSTLGLREGDDLASAIREALSRTPVDDSRVAVFGVSLGAYAGFQAALQEERIRVLILDSPYPSVFGFLNHQVSHRLGFHSLPVSGAVSLLVSAVNLVPPRQIFEEGAPEHLFPGPILFVAGEEHPPFGDWSRHLYSVSAGDRDLLVLPRSRKTLLYTDEVTQYDQQILEFLTRHLPL